MVADPVTYLGHYPGWSTDLHALPYATLCRLARYTRRLGDASNAPDALTRCLTTAVSAHAPDSRLIVEAASSVGTELRALAPLADFVIGFDHSLPETQVAVRQLAGETVFPLERLEGRSFRSAPPIQFARLDNVVAVVGDALDPPVQAECADVVVALNLLDCVHDPVALLGQLDAITAPGGLLIVSSPFAWQDSITPPERQLATLEPLSEVAGWPSAGKPLNELSAYGSAAALHTLLRGDSPLLNVRHTIVETHELSWTLQDNARATSHYTVHVCVSRKSG